jgi:predicted N-acyltransferase
VPIHSAHHLRHEGLAAAVGRFVEEERRHNEAVIEELGARSPYR